MDTLMNWLAFACLVYGLGTGMHWWPGPVVTTRHLLSSRHDRSRSDTDDTVREDTRHGVVSAPEPPADPDPVEFAPGVHIAPDPRVRVIQRPTAPVPLDELTGGRTSDEPEPDGVAVLPDHVTERRRWVRARLDPEDALQLSPVEIDRRGAELFGCAERTIQRDRERITRQRIRGHRPPADRRSRPS